MNPDQLIVEARAKISWGDEPSSVYEFLTSNGVSDADAGQTVQELVAERNKEIRRLGIQGTCIGAAVLCAAGICLWREAAHLATHFRWRGADVMGFAGLVALYGLWRLVNGLIQLLRPQMDTRSIPDMTE